jgi:hypothetical protein
MYAPLLAAIAVALWREGDVAARAAVGLLGAALAVRLVAGAVYLAVDYRPGDARRRSPWPLSRGSSSPAGCSSRPRRSASSGGRGGPSFPPPVEKSAVAFPFRVRSSKFYS